jgi:predicted transcriptional regulator
VSAPGPDEILEMWHDALVEYGRLCKGKAAAPLEGRYVKRYDAQGLDPISAAYGRVQALQALHPLLEEELLSPHPVEIARGLPRGRAGRLPQDASGRGPSPQAGHKGKARVSAEPAQVMGKLDALAVELDQRSSALANTERELADVEDKYDAFYEDFIAGWFDAEEGKRLPGEDVRRALAHRHLRKHDPELLGKYRELSRRRDRLKRRIETLGRAASAQQSILKALREECRPPGATGDFLPPSELEVPIVRGGVLLTLPTRPPLGPLPKV